MDSMDLYPAGFVPSGCPTVSQHLTADPHVAMLEASLVIPGVRLPVASVPTGPFEEERLSTDDVELLERLLHGCHLTDVEAVSSSNIAQNVGALPSVSPSAIDPWAGEMVRRLHGCPSSEEARSRCAEVLVSFKQEHQNQHQAINHGSSSGPEPERLRMLQGANRVLLRGFRNLYRRQCQMDSQRQAAEERYSNMAAELARTQEALRASERANASLQFHLQLMKSPLGMSAGVR